MYEKIKERFSTQEEIFRWIEDLCSTPHRRTGTEESKIAREYIKRQFEDMGYDDVKIEKTPSVTFEVGDCFLEVCGQNIDCFMVNGTLHPEETGSFEAGEKCVDTEIIYLGEGREEDFEGVDVKGKIVLCECPWFDMDEDSYAKNWCETEGIVYDPEASERKKLRKTDSYSPDAWPYNYFTAQKKGAVGFVGVLTDYFKDGINWNEDYGELAESQGCKAMELPGLWIGVDAFSRLKDLLSFGKAPASMGMKTSYKEGEAANIWAVLPGMTGESILIHSHYDAVFTGAVQDASGMSEVMALAKYFRGIPKENRKKTMIFAGLDGHYTDYAGHQKFVSSRLNEGRKISCDFVIEHIGKEVGIGEDNMPVISDEPEIRLMYVTDNNGMVDMVHNIIEKNHIKRTVILPVKPYEDKGTKPYEFSQDEVISDAYYSHLAGIPVISMLSPQMYLFHPMDKPDMIPKDQLVPIGVTFAEMIHRFCE